MTIGEPAELMGLSASFLLQYFGRKEVFRVPVAMNWGYCSSEVLAACRILIELAGDSQGAANQIQVVVQTEAGSDGEALFDGFARARDEACCGR